MGDIRVLRDQLELGVPRESAMMLAGYSFEDIDRYEKDPEVMGLLKMTKATFISKHLAYLNAAADEKPQISQWLLERVASDGFSPTQKVVDVPIKKTRSIRIRGIKPKVLDD